MWEDENYYLVGFDSAYNEIRHFRVDKMLKISCTEEVREGKEYFEKFNLAEYSKKNFGMFSGEEEIVKLQVHKDLIGVIIDRFGKDVMIVPAGETDFRINVKVAVSPQFFGWIFGLGDKIKILGPKTIVKRMKEEGHLVGNHTVRHLSSPDLTPEELKVELDTVANMMLELTGYEIDSFFRPPMGEYSKRTLQVTKDLGYKSIFWSIAYYDYDVNDQPGKEYVVDHFKTYHHSGAIALLHNVSESNTQALEDVILLLKAEGYRLASLEELE